LVRCESSCYPRKGGTIGSGTFHVRKEQTGVKKKKNEKRFVGLPGQKKKKRGSRVRGKEYPEKKQREGGGRSKTQAKPVRGMQAMCGGAS